MKLDIYRTRNTHFEEMYELKLNFCLLQFFLRHVKNAIFLLYIKHIEQLEKQRY